jgi:hypothetical protein
LDRKQTEEIGSPRKEIQVDPKESISISKEIRSPPKEMGGEQKEIITTSKEIRVPPTIRLQLKEDR